jgi:hypothetical protein
MIISFRLQYGFIAGSTTRTDQEIVARIRGGDTALYEVLMRRYNQRLFRIARSILKDDSEAEDVMQEAYVRAYAFLHQFDGRAQFSTGWQRSLSTKLPAASENGSAFWSSRHVRAKEMILWNRLNLPLRIRSNSF